MRLFNTADFQSINIRRVSARQTPDPKYSHRAIHIALPTFGVTTRQTGRAVIHHDDGLGMTLVAQGGRGRVCIILSS